MSPSENQCPLCGYKFEKGAPKCASCPMSKTCGECCPNCGYSLAPKSKIADWIGAKLSKRKKDDKDSNGSNGEEKP